MPVAVAQIAEQLTTDLKVKGSNLAVIGDGRKLRKLKFFLKKFEIKNFELENFNQNKSVSKSLNKASFDKMKRIWGLRLRICYVTAL
jgi:hypothetical protein